MADNLEISETEAYLAINKFIKTLQKRIIELQSLHQPAVAVRCLLGHRLSTIYSRTATIARL